ncbi:MAG: hypothetical protein V4667_05790 [Bacteroidota bacterium]
MKTKFELDQKKKIKRILIVFITLLLLSGITAFPIEIELQLLQNIAIKSPNVLSEWITTVYNAISITNNSFPYLSYGTDWLAFAHIVIAGMFIGPLKDPIKNIWIIQFGIVACIMVIPTAFLCGYIRHIPFYWQLIDCSFGVFGMIPLIICKKKITILENLKIK